MTKDKTQKEHRKKNVSVDGNKEKETLTRHCLHFIPAWYEKGFWREHGQSWYDRQMYNEFDDTVKQVQLIHRNTEIPYEIIVLGFSPNLRHFLHRQGIYHAPYWSLFDAITQVTKTKIETFTFRDLHWPDRIEFVYTSFAVLAFLDDEKYAQIELGEDGNIIQIIRYEKGLVHRRDIYDDRGFVGNSIIYENGQIVYQEFLTEDGAWKLREYMPDFHVEINPRIAQYTLNYKVRRGENKQDTEAVLRFRSLRYASIADVIKEVLHAYVRYADLNDIFCVAMHRQHIDLLTEVLADRKYIMSFFKNRFEFKSRQEAMDYIKLARYVIADTDENMAHIKIKSGRIDNMMCISPYDYRGDFGISTSLNVQKIFVPVDGIAEGTLDEIIIALAEYIDTNDDAEVQFLTRIADYGRPADILSRARMILSSREFPVEWALEGQVQNLGENEVDEVIPQRFFVEQCVDDLAVSKCMRKQRVLVDLRRQPDLYLQIMALSVGIPQIVRRITDFVEPEQNGIIIHKIENLKEALSYYLDTMAHWNDAMIASREIGKSFGADVLLGKWKEVLDCVG